MLSEYKWADKPELYGYATTPIEKELMLLRKKTIQKLLIVNSEDIPLIVFIEPSATEVSLKAGDELLFVGSSTEEIPTVEQSSGAVTVFSWSSDMTAYLNKIELDI